MLLINIVLAIIILILVFTILSIIWWYVYLSRFKSFEKIPGPKPLPIVGNAFDLGNTPTSVLANLMKLTNEYSGFFKLYIGTHVHLVFARPELMKSIMSSNVHITKGQSYKQLYPWLGDGLVFSTGEKWRKRKRLIAPTFHLQILERFNDTFNRIGDILVQKLLNQVGNESVNVYTYINCYALDVISETSLGVKIDSLNNKNVDFTKAIDGYINIFINKVFSFWKQNNFLFRLTSSYLLEQSYLKTLLIFTNKIMKDRREQVLNNENIENETTYNDKSINRTTSLMDMLLRLENTHNLSDDDVREETNTFMFAGHDTVTSAISFALLSLSKHQNIQQKVYEEIEQVIGHDKNTVITLDQLQDMTYLEMVVKETLRCYPSGSLVERQMETDDEINGHFIPKGTSIMMFIYGLHHQEEFYPNPEKFDPDRFLPESHNNRDPFAYVPFGAGPRNCIGKRFALLEMKSVLIKILQHFKLLPVLNYKPIFQFVIILKTINGILVRLQHR